MAELGTRFTIERVKIGHSLPKAARACALLGGSRHPACRDGQPREREEPSSQAKPFSIAKRVVVEAYKRVKANGGAAGVDAESIEAPREDADRLRQG